MSPRKTTRTAVPDVPAVIHPPAPYDPAPFQQARQDIRELLTTPLQAWMLTPPAYRRDRAYTALLTAPLDLAAAGYVVTVSQEEAGWRVDVRRELTTGCMLHLYGEAPSYVAMLYRLADMAHLAIDGLQSKAKRRAAEQDGVTT